MLQTCDRLQTDGCYQVYFLSASQCYMVDKKQFTLLLELPNLDIVKCSALH